MGEQKRLGDAPVEEKYRQQMNAIAQTLDEFLNDNARGSERKTGFVLLVYPFDGPEGARCNFISNGADRRDLCTLFREMIARFEGQPEMKGTA